MNEPVVVAFLILDQGSDRVRVDCEAGLVHVHAGPAHLTLRLPPDERVEQALLSALQHGHEGVRLAAARALGEVGTADAVSWLRDLAHGPSNHSYAQRRIALPAIVDIQARLHGAPGQLTMAAEAGGEVSLAAEGGELSLAPRRRPRA